MALSAKEVISRGLDMLAEGLAPFVEREMKRKGEPLKSTHDPYELLKVMTLHWQTVFSAVLGELERSLTHELKTYRNKVAHNETVTADDAERTLDSVYRLLSAVGAGEVAEKVYDERQGYIALRQQDKARLKAKRAVKQETFGTPTVNLRPWRDVISPHPDVAQGVYQQSEFAADLWQVYQGKGSAEYCDPRSFFERTYLTENLRKLLKEAILRLSGKGGTPVFKLETNFGGGKTHCLLSLFHVFSGTPAEKMFGIDELLRECGVKQIPKVNRAVIVGTMGIAPGQPSKKADGTVVRTLWGEIAWQLGGKAGYEIVRGADESGTSPGEALNALFEKFAPCIILIDEWIRYACQLKDEPGDPGGTFDAQMSFAQALSEAAKTPKTMLVFSLPISNYEIGGTMAERAQKAIGNVLKRVDSPLRPAGAEESFEIVRRRLFQPVTDTDARDAVVHAFSDLYRGNKQEFPSECAEKAYMDRMAACYPIHPELFDRIYNDWAALERFQHTRGVLRLMAKVIQVLWENQDANLMILPGMIPLADNEVQSELTRYLGDDAPRWQSVICTDVDGDNSTTMKLDRQYNNLWKLSATRRVARALFMRSAPVPTTAAARGLEDRQVRLGCVQPGETIPQFGDALRMLADSATYLYVDARRYWYDLKQSVVRLAKDRTEQVKGDEAYKEITTRLMDEQRKRGAFARIYPCPPTSGDVPDERETRLVLIGPEKVHTPKAEKSDALEYAKDILANRGTSPRKYRNTLLFLAADAKRMEELIVAVKGYLAWKSIYDEADKGRLELDNYQRSQAKTKKDDANDTVNQRLRETYIWALVPDQQKDEVETKWLEIKLQANGTIVERVSSKLEKDEHFIKSLGPTMLRRHMDNVPLWRGADHAAVKTLMDDFATYLYLPRLQSPDVLLNTILAGLQSGKSAGNLFNDETFALAEYYDDDKKRYVGLRTAGVGLGDVTGYLLVKPDVAEKQLAQVEPPVPIVPTPPVGPGTGTGIQPPPPPPPPTPKVKRFHGTVSLDPVRWAKEASKVADEVIRHLQGVDGAKISITLEIEADLPNGIPDDAKRTVIENCNTLKFKAPEFEEG